MKVIRRIFFFMYASGVKIMAIFVAAAIVGSDAKAETTARRLLWLVLILLNQEYIRLEFIVHFRVSANNVG